MYIDKNNLGVGILRQGGVFGAIRVQEFTSSDEVDHINRDRKLDVFKGLACATVHSRRNFS